MAKAIITIAILALLAGITSPPFIEGRANASRQARVIAIREAPTRRLKIWRKEAPKDVPIRLSCGRAAPVEVLPIGRVRKALVCLFIGKGGRPPRRRRISFPSIAPKNCPTIRPTRLTPNASSSLSAISRSRRTRRGTGTGAWRREVAVSSQGLEI